MSQEKVNKYKQEKANRRSILKKEKRNRILARLAGTVVCVAIIGWIGFSVYDSAQKKAASTQTEVDLTAVNDYMTALNAADTAEETAAEK